MLLTLKSFAENLFQRMLLTLIRNDGRLCAKKFGKKFRRPKYFEGLQTGFRLSSIYLSSSVEDSALLARPRVWKHCLAEWTNAQIKIFRQVGNESAKKHLLSLFPEKTQHLLFVVHNKY